MNKNYIFIALALVVVVSAGIFIENNFRTNTKPEANSSPADNSANNSVVKEFTMDSFYEIVNDQPKPQYSLKEINVKKGDTVRIQITVTRGSHDFIIDEYGINTQTPLNQPITIEFVADKAGEFIYYCSRPGHRANGHWGTLRVTE